MAVETSKKIVKKILLFVVGWMVLVVGIALVLGWWPFVVVIFKGVAGMTMALIGLLILFMVKG